MSVTSTKIIGCSRLIPFSLEKVEENIFWLIPSLSLCGLAMPEGGWLNLEEGTFPLCWNLYCLFPGI